jgi:pimeloyl-ACP methyl ester carboxylesterase
MDSFKKEFDNYNTYYEQCYNINSIPTIFIHGVGLDNTMWYPQKKLFKNNSVIFYDILNHGKSKKGYNILTFNNFSDQLNNLLNHLKVNKINLVGFSIGALIAQHFSLKYTNKINKLVLIGSVYKRSKEQIKIVRNRYEETKEGVSITEESINRWFSKSYLKENPNVYKFFFDLLENKRNKDFIPAYKVFVESDKNNLDFSKFDIPTLIMTGENEIGSTPKMSEELNKDINNSILYIIKDAKHGATIEKDDDVNQQLVKFLLN